MNLNLSEKLKTGLTPKEKIDCYEQAISEIYFHSQGICLELYYCFDNPFGVSYQDIKKLFPEFAKLKPKNRTYKDYWFNSTEERIQVLNKLIEEQKKLL